MQRSMDSWSSLINYPWLYFNYIILLRLLPSWGSAAHYFWRYTKFLLFRVQSPAELYIVEISIFAVEIIE